MLSFAPPPPIAAKRRLHSAGVSPVLRPDLGLDAGGSADEGEERKDEEALVPLFVILREMAYTLRYGQHRHHRSAYCFHDDLSSFYASSARRKLRTELHDLEKKLAR